MVGTLIFFQPFFFSSLRLWFHFMLSWHFALRSSHKNTASGFPFHLSRGFPDWAFDYWCLSGSCFRYERFFLLLSSYEKFHFVLMTSAFWCAGSKTGHKNRQGVRGVAHVPIRVAFGWQTLPPQVLACHTTNDNMLLAGESRAAHYATIP